MKSLKGVGCGMAVGVVSAAALAVSNGPNASGEADALELVRQLRTNYAGYAYRAALIGDQLEAAEADLSGRAASLDDEALDARMRAYLALFRDGHLRLDSRHSRASEPDRGFVRVHFDRTPQWQALDDRTGVLMVPSFEGGWRQSIRSLLEANAAALEVCETLIIDLRGNGGGSDASYEPLMAYVMDGPYEVVGTRSMATEENAAYIEEMVAEIPEELADIRAWLSARAAAMRDHGKGLMPGGERRVVTPESVHDSPRRVGVIVDAGCASTTEQFLLAARQSGRVTLFGDRTRGALDFANMRDAPLPSGSRTVHYGMTITGRLPGEPVDPTGLEVEVPMPHDALYDRDGAIRWVKDWFDRAD